MFEDYWRWFQIIKEAGPILERFRDFQGELQVVMGETVIRNGGGEALVTILRQLFV